MEISYLWDGEYTWLVIPDEDWATAEFMDYIEGWPIYARRP